MYMLRHARGRHGLEREDGGFVIVGSDPSCDIQFGDDEVSAIHARFLLDESGLSIENLSRRGTSVEGMPIRGRAALMAGSVVRLGDLEIEVELTGQRIATNEPARPTRIMVIDDSELIVLTTVALLQDAGYEAVGRTEAMGTSSALLKERIDLLLLDVEMPALSGPKLVELLSERGATGKLRVVLFSSRPQAELDRLAQECGADGAITKDDPLTFLRNLRRLVDRLLSTPAPRGRRT
jgi:CheY-like chemotaxis protein